MERFAAITGIGCVTKFGVGIAQTWDALLNGEALSDSLAASEPLAAGGIRLAQAPPAAELEQLIPGLSYPRPPRTSLLARLAAHEAWEMARLPESIDHDRVGLVINRNFGQHQIVARYCNTLWNKGPGGVSGLQFVQTTANAVLGSLAIKLQLRGPSLLFFGSSALGISLDLLRDDQADVILAGGLDELSDYALDLCAAWNLVPPLQGTSGRTRPYDPFSIGLMPGDGAIFFILERPGYASARRVKPLGYLRGYSSLTDKMSQAKPMERCSADIAESIQRAIRDADISLKDVAFISGAAAGLHQSDRAELEAIAASFTTAPPVSSIKGAIGETWGSSGGLSVMLAVLALQHRILPPTVGTQNLHLGLEIPVVTRFPHPVSGTSALALSFDLAVDAAGQDSAYVISSKL